MSSCVTSVRVFLGLFAVTSLFGQSHISTLDVDYNGTSHNEAGDHFGRAVGISGLWSIAAAPDWDAPDMGAVFFFRGDTLAQTVLAPSGTDDSYASNVAIAGEHALVSADLYDCTSPVVGNCGAVYYYHYEQTGNGKQWVQVGQPITHPPISGAGARFGYCLALNGAGNRAAIGAPSGSGVEAFVYSRTGTTWSQLGSNSLNRACTLGPCDCSSNQYCDCDNPQVGSTNAFATVVAMSSEGERVLVSAPQYPSSVSGPGAVWVYTLSGSGWANSCAPLTPSDGQSGDRFGAGIAIDGDLVLVGSPTHDGNDGKVYPYRWNSGNQQWDALPEITSPNGGLFGNYIAIDGYSAVISAHAEASSSAGGGAAYYIRYDPGTESWGVPLRITAPAPESSASFGGAVGLSAGRVLIGEPSRDEVGSGSGLAYIFTFAGCDVCDFDPCDANCDGSVNPFDTQPFLDVLNSEGTGCSACQGDVNCDGSANAFDINGFLACIGA